jgi:hypothetical protein
MGQFGVPAEWKGRKPAMWDPKTAIPFCHAVNLIDVYLDPSVPFSHEMLVLIFFHETAFSIVTQGGDNPRGPGFGFGQLELDNPRNPTGEFLQLEFGTTQRKTIVEKTVGDPYRAVQMHCNFLKWLMSRQKNPTQNSLLAGQVGSKNAEMIPKFRVAEQQLKASIYSDNRKSIIDALNSCRWYLPGKGETGLIHRPIPLKLFPDYWEFTLPESDLVWGIRK